MNFEDNVENVEGDLTTFLIYDKFLEKLDSFGFKIQTYPNFVYKIMVDLL